MRIILLGCPGAGKGTQALFITKHYDIPKISTGDMLRKAIQEKTRLGIEIKQTVESGKLVSDAIIIELVNERIKQADCHSGFLFDGFPRTLAQIKAIHSEKIRINYIIEIVLEEEESIRRLSGRRIHLSSGRTYHTKYQPPRVEGKDDVTGEPLVQREDDQEETIKKRLQVYREQIDPMLNFCKNWVDADAPQYIQIDGSGDAYQVRDQIFSALEAE